MNRRQTSPDPDRSIAEWDRSQWRFDWADWDDAARYNVVRLLADGMAPFGSWRFTSAALWVNETSPLIPALRQIFGR